MTSSSHPSNPEQRGIDPPSLDAVLSLLADHRRRRVVTGLLEETPRSVEELAQTAGWEDAWTLEIALTHTHLPKLQEAGVIDWETDAGVVRRGAQFDAVASIVGLIRSNQGVLPVDRT